LSVLFGFILHLLFSSALPHKFFLLATISDLLSSISQEGRNRSSTMKLYYNFASALWTLALLAPPTTSTSSDAAEVLDTETFVTNENDIVDTSTQPANTRSIEQRRGCFLARPASTC
jgi:hypothetical protein